MILDWRWIVAKRIVNRKWENGFCVTFDTIFDHSEPVAYTADYGFGGKPSVVRTVSIDSLNVKPTVVKLDVEGAEYCAVKGGIVTILAHRPKLFIEIHHPDNEKRIIEALPGYSWKKHYRLMQPKGKKEFYQTQMIGEYSWT